MNASNSIRICIATFVAAFATSSAIAQLSWQQKEFFENSESVRAHFYSEGNVSAPSTLELIDGKLPVDTSTFVSAPNSLRLAWTSAPNGEWDVELRLPNWPNRYIDFTGNTLSLWLYSKEAMQGHDLPMICLHDSGNGFSEKVRLSDYAHELPAAKWTRLLIPIRAFQSRSVRPFEPSRTNTIVFLQNDPDGHAHSVLIDNVRIETLSSKEATPKTPSNLRAKGYERHVLLTWDAANDPNVAEYVIYRSLNGGPFIQVQTQRPDIHRAVDFVNQVGISANYRVTARTSGLRESAPSDTVHASTHAMTDDELLTMVQEASFSYYWDGAEPNSGLARESIPGDPDMIAVGGSGFGIMSLIVGAERGFAPRDQIVDRMLRITAYLAHADRYHGAWPHFLSGRHRASASGIWSVRRWRRHRRDLLPDGRPARRTWLLHARHAERTATSRRNHRPLARRRVGLVQCHARSTTRSTGTGRQTSASTQTTVVGGWNETLMPYLLGIASPTHPIPAKPLLLRLVLRRQSRSELRQTKLMATAFR